MKFLILFLVSIAVVSSDLNAQGCLIAANAQDCGYCNDIDIPCDKKNFHTIPDYKTDLFDYQLLSFPSYKKVQKFGRTGSHADDFQDIDLRMMIPVNNQIKRPLIVYSPLSSFTHSNLNGLLIQYIGSYFAMKGYVFVCYGSRHLLLKNSEMNTNSTLADYITNTHYLSDPKVLNHFSYYKDTLNADYGFFQFIEGLSKTEISDQLISDAYYEMMYKNSFDLHYALEAMQIWKDIFKIDMGNIFVMGASAGSVQAMTASFLDHPDQMDTELYPAMLQYKGLNYPNPGSLAADFQEEHSLVYNVKPRGVINLWGRIPTLEIIDKNEPAIISVHGTWDETFPYQKQKSIILPEVISGFGAEGIYIKAREENLNAGIISICQGGHALFPQISGNCQFSASNGKVFLDTILYNISSFVNSIVKGQTHVQTIVTLESPKTFSEPASFTLCPPESKLFIDSNSVCPASYPEDFNLKLYGLDVSIDDNNASSSFDFRLLSYASLYPAYVSFELKTPSIVTLAITNMEGKEIEVIRSDLEAGKHIIPVNWKEKASGIYQFTLFTGTLFATKRTVVMF